MKYLGGKYAIANRILELILPHREDRPWVEPFVGGANVLWRVSGKRFANDSHPELMAMYQALVQGWIPPSSVSKSEYLIMKDNPGSFPDCLIGFVGFAGSFGGKWWGGYAQGANRNFVDESARALLKIKDKLKDVSFSAGSYQDMPIPSQSSVIYCDPPYAGTTAYSCGEFDNSQFWDWCRSKADEGHLVFVSEYKAPSDVELVAEFHKTSSLIQKNTKSSIERLFRINKRRLTYLNQIRG